VLEQTHRSSGGRVWPLDELAAVAGTARELGLAVHLDGARIMNASVASGLAAAKFGRLADSVTICFSKGLGCPLGAVLATSRVRVGLLGPGVLRVATYLGVSDDDVDQAIELIPKALSVVAQA